ncbi:Hypothetical predicted protein [Olea europaea subsp. europaea]|uniref:Uncharacterized protein n=1 Tax=Olea europaea subsp. europaea TaxID=158383 RepID=A0A8S0UDV2_OLEEU|nr:Hypothetical predicted protein [Olea europaea subsp. europaea]
MDEILAKTIEKRRTQSARVIAQQEKVTHIQQTIDKKGKVKMDPADEMEYSYFPSTPSLDLVIASTPIVSNVVNLPNMFSSKDVQQQQVDAVIAGVVKDFEIDE